MNINNTNINIPIDDDNLNDSSNDSSNDDSSDSND